MPSLFGTVRSAWVPEAARTGLSRAALGLRAPPRLPRPPSGEEPPYPEAEGARGSAPTPAASQVWVVPIYWKRRRLAAVDKTQTHWRKITSFHQFQRRKSELSVVASVCVTARSARGFRASLVFKVLLFCLFCFCFNSGGKGDLAKYLRLASSAVSPCLSPGVAITHPDFT